MVAKLSRVARIVLGKIIIKVLLAPGIKRWFRRIVELYEIAQIERGT